MNKTNWFHVVDSGTDAIAASANTTLRNEGIMGAVGIGRPAELDIDTPGKFVNDRLVVAAGHGTVVLSGVATNDGTEEAVSGGRLQIEAATVNTGRIVADGGTVTVENTLAQKDGGTISVTHNGTLSVTGPISGGTININSGTLQLEGPSPLLGLSSTVNFTGRSGAIDFAGAKSVVENFSTIFHSVVATVDYGANGGIVSKEIALPPSGFSAADFAARGTEIVYTPHH